MNAAEELLDCLKRQTETSRQIACLRIKHVNEKGESLASTFAPLIHDAVCTFLGILDATSTSSSSSSSPSSSSINEASTVNSGKQELSDQPLTIFLRALLEFHLYLSQQDATLGEELGGAGSHAALVQLMRYDGSRHDDDLLCEATQDAIMELQHLACEIAATCARFPLKRVEYSLDDLYRRLPLDFRMAPAKMLDASGNRKTLAVRVLIHQVTIRQSAQVDVGFGM
jgi:hypothetical protein